MPFLSSWRARNDPAGVTVTVPTRGIAFPTDLAAWRRWQNSRRRISRLANRARTAAGRTQSFFPLFATGPDDADVIIAFDTVNPATVSTLHEVVVRLQDDGAAVAVVDSGDSRLRHAAPGETRAVAPESVFAGSVVGIGHYTAVGSAMWHVSRQRGGRFFVLQHGLLTPFAPPLPHGAHLLAWSQDDAEFWLADRPDTRASAVGSHMLSSARADSASSPGGPSTDRPLFLGQMHGAELGWPVKLRSAIEFCRTNGADYRPHPSETSRLSRAAHSALRAAGIAIDTNDAPLAERNGPVAGMFSTGLLEAAAAGQHTYGVATGAPQWVNEFWNRYGIGQWPDEPTRLDESLAPREPEAVIRAIADEVMSQ